MTDIPTTTTQGEALEARARELLAAEYAREGHLAYALEIKRGNLNRVGMGPSIRAIIAALQPNIDHAVGGLAVESPDDDGKMRGAPPVPPMSEAELQAAIARARNDLRVEYAALSAPQQPVKLDAVREALGMARDLIQEAKGADGPDGGFVTNHLDAAENWLDKVEAALATPATDTGLDPATVERCAKVAEEFARGDQGTAEGYLESAKTAESTSGRDVDVDTAVGVFLTLAAARQIATLIRDLASGDRS